MSVMWVIILHQYTKLELRTPSHSEDMADIASPHQLAWRPWPLTF